MRLVSVLPLNSVVFRILALNKNEINTFFYSLNIVWSSMLKWLMICLEVGNQSLLRIWKCLMITTYHHLCTTKHLLLILLTLDTLMDNMALFLHITTIPLILPAIMAQIMELLAEKNSKPATHSKLISMLIRVLRGKAQCSQYCQQRPVVTLWDLYWLCSTIKYTAGH